MSKIAQISRFQYLKLAKNKINLFFKENKLKIFTLEILSNVLMNNKSNWNLANITTLKDFINFLLQHSIIKKTLEINLPLGKKTIRYITGDYYDYEIGLSIYKNSYCSHYTAMYLNGLTNNIPKVIFVNFEQTLKPMDYGTQLSQENINKAFSNKMRTTNQIASYEDIKIYMLSSKNTNNLGVEIIDKNEKAFKITNIEITLIDITVRPEYAGGIVEIIEAYKLAKDKCSINIILSMLKELGYKYPYHQAIGFYMEKAGYKESLLKVLETIPMIYDFYLCYKIADKDYSKRWKLFFPKGI